MQVEFLIAPDSDARGYALGRGHIAFVVDGVFIPPVDDRHSVLLLPDLSLLLDGLRSLATRDQEWVRYRPAGAAFDMLLLRDDDDLTIRYSKTLTCVTNFQAAIQSAIASASTYLARNGSELASHGNCGWVVAEFEEALSLLIASSDGRIGSASPSKKKAKVQRRRGKQKRK